jgi:hypothetical protein
MLAAHMRRYLSLVVSVSVSSRLNIARRPFISNRFACCLLSPQTTLLPLAPMSKTIKRARASAGSSADALPPAATAESYTDKDLARFKKEFEKNCKKDLVSSALPDNLNTILFKLMEQPRKILPCLSLVMGDALLADAGTTKAAGAFDDDPTVPFDEMDKCGSLPKYWVWAWLTQQDPSLQGSEISAAEKQDKRFVRKAAEFVTGLGEHLGFPEEMLDKGVCARVFNARKQRLGDRVPALVGAMKSAKASKEFDWQSFGCYRFGPKAENGQITTIKHVSGAEAAV